jgi:hypothetical protein
MNIDRDELLALAERLSDVDDAEAQRVAAALKQLAEAKRGRPQDPADVRAVRKVVRAWTSNSLYAGTYPAPEGDEVRVRAAKGNRTEADAIAAEFLGVSSAAVASARRGIISDKATVHLEADELMALLRLRFTGRI